MKKTALITSLLAVAVSVWFATPTFAADEKDEPEVKIKIPDTAAGILKEVKQHEEELSKTITDKKLDDVHHHAFAIRDLVNALPDKSNDLAADKLAKLKANAKFVTDLAKRLDESGDGKDQAGTEANFKKLQGILKQIRALYPDSVSKSSAEATAQYTCPMHPEVVQDKPGNCPKCGMKLVVKK
jgi:rubrerythrin